MNLEENKKTIMQLILFTVIIIFAFVNIKSILNIVIYIINLFMPFILGLIIAFILNVLLNVIENKIFKKVKSKLWKKIKRPTSLIISLIIIIAIIAFILGLLIPQLHNTINIFTQNFNNYKIQSIEILNNIGIDNNTIDKINNSITNISNEISNYLTNNKKEVMQTTVNVASNLISGITSLILGIVFAIYMLLKKEDFARQLNKVLKAYLPEKKQNKIHEIAKLSNTTFSNFITGQCLEAIIIGILCFVGMLILQIPYASTISILVGFSALIPVFGAFIGTLIGAFLILMISPIKAIIFIIFIIILQQIEGNFIYPKVVGKSVGLPAIWVMLAVTIGASVYGIIGMLVSVPICSILYSIIKANVNNKLKNKK